MRRTAHLSACTSLYHMLQVALAPGHDDTAGVLVVVCQDGEIAAHTVLALELNIDGNWESKCLHFSWERGHLALVDATKAGGPRSQMRVLPQV